MRYGKNMNRATDRYAEGAFRFCLKHGNKVMGEHQLKILLLNYEFPPLGGGAGRAMWNILRQWRGRDDLSFHVVTAAFGESRDEKMASNIDLHLLDIGKKEGVHQQSAVDLIRYSYGAWRYVLNLNTTIEFDLCHAFFGIPCGFIAQELGLPYIVSLRGSDVPFYSRRFRVFDRLFFRRLSQRIWSGASEVVANSRGLKRLAERTMPEADIQVIPNGVDTDRFYPDDIRNDEFRVLSVARLIPRKRLSSLVRAIGMMSQNNIRLTIVGEGPERSRLENIVQDMNIGERVCFEGRIPHERLPQIYRSHDVFVLPSENEGMSNTALEAMASGLALIMPRTGGADELLVDGKNGVLMESGTTAQIIMALRRYCCDPALLKDHGKRSRQIAEGMSWGSVANRYERVYRAVKGGLIR